MIVIKQLMILSFLQMSKLSKILPLHCLGINKFVVYLDNLLVRDIIFFPYSYAILTKEFGLII